MRTSNHVVLCAMLIPAANALAAGGAAPERLALVPGSVEMQMPAAIGAHLSVGSDPVALLSSIQSAIANPAATDAQLLSAVKLADAMTDSDKSVALEMGMTDKQAAKTVDDVSTTVQSNAALMEQWKKASKAIRIKLMQTGRLSAEQIAAAIDGSQTAAGEDATAAVDASAATRRSVPHLQLQPQMKPQAAAPSPRSNPAALVLTRLGDEDEPEAVGESSPKTKAAPAKDASSAKQDEEDYTRLLTDAEKQYQIAKVDAWLRYDHRDEFQVRQARGAAEDVGADIQLEAVRKSELLRKPVDVTYVQGDGDGGVGKALTELKNAKMRLDPSHVNFNPGFVGRLIAKRAPWGKSPEQKLVKLFTDSITTIEETSKMLTEQRTKLREETEVLRREKSILRDVIHDVSRALGEAQFVRGEFLRRIDSGELHEEHAEFIRDEILSELDNRIIDLKLQLQFNEQGFAAVHGFIEYNKIILPLVTRAVNIVPAMLHVAALNVKGLSGTDKHVQDVNALTNEAAHILAASAERANIQGRDIMQAIAGSSAAQAAVLKELHRQISELDGDIETARAQATPELTQTVEKLNKLKRKSARKLLEADADSSDGSQAKPEGTIIGY